MNLFYDRVEVKSRFEHFILECQGLLNVASQQIDFHYNQHHHDVETLTAYLTLMYPDKYVFYDFPHFKNFLEKVKAREEARQDDLERYFKTHRIIHTIISKNIEVQKWLDSEINTGINEGRNLIFSHEFINYVGSE